MNLLIAAAIILAGGFGTSQMADSSLPGDALYGVKVHVNEPMKHAFAFSAESDAKVSAEILNRRAEEARALQSEGRLDAEAKAELSSSIESEMQAWNMYGKNMEDKGDAQAVATARAAFTSDWQTNSEIYNMLNIKLNTSATGSTNNGSSTNVNGNTNTNVNSGTNGSSSTSGSGTLDVFLNGNSQ